MEAGDLIYYTGDMANMSGWFRIARVNAPTQYAPLSYDLEELGGGDDRELRGIYAISVGDVYRGHCNPRFVTEDAYHAYRREQLARLAS